MRGPFHVIIYAGPACSLSLCLTFFLSTPLTVKIHEGSAHGQEGSAKASPRSSPLLFNQREPPRVFLLQLLPSSTSPEGKGSPHTHAHRHLMPWTRLDRAPRQPPLLRPQAPQHRRGFIPMPSGALGRHPRRPLHPLLPLLHGSEQPSSSMTRRRPSVTSRTSPSCPRYTRYTLLPLSQTPCPLAHRRCRTYDANVVFPVLYESQSMLRLCILRSGAPMNFSFNQIMS